MAANTREENSPLSSWNEKAMQRLFQHWAREVGMQGRKNQLAWVYQPTGKLRKIRKNDVRDMVEGREINAGPRRRRSKRADWKPRKTQENGATVQCHERGNRWHSLPSKTKRQTQGPDPTKRWPQSWPKSTQGRAESTKRWTKPTQERQGNPTQARRPKPTTKKEEKMKRKLIFWNVAGGLGAKFDVVKSIIDNEQPCAFFIFESNIKINSCFKHLSVNNYDLHTTSTNFSRTACYVLRGCGFKVVNNGEGNEAIIIENNKYRIIGAYRPFKTQPNETLVGNFDRLLRFLEKESSTDKELVVSGDLNVDLLGNRDGRLKNDLEIWALNNGLCQQVKSITRRRTVQLQDGNLRIEESALDHFYTSDREIKCHLMENPFSDHMILSCVLEVDNSATIKLKRRDWRGYCVSSMEQYTNERNAEYRKLKRFVMESASPDDILKALNEYLKRFTDTVAPFRCTTMRRPQDIIDSAVSGLKKKRDRALKKFYQSKSPEDHSIARSLTKSLKKKIKEATRRKYQVKACSGNQKDFWSVVKEMSGKKSQNEKMNLIIDNTTISDPKRISNAIADFFSNKVNMLVEKTGLGKITIPQPEHQNHQITKQDVLEAIKSMKRKKACGIDGIPMIVIVDSANILSDEFTKLFNLCLLKIPTIWKTALVKPLHKSGSKTDPGNYRPISNLCSLEKVYERVLLKELTKINDGNHQHGYKARHSTTTAMLTIQNIISEKLNDKEMVLVYSLDLSAAFDMLRVDKFYDMFKEEIPKWLMFTLCDFLTGRKCMVEVEDSLSSTRDVPLGCVQGSVLGPRIFNLYTSKIPQCLPENIEIISYADDSYVVVSGQDEQELVKNAETAINAHVNALLELGMIVNSKKTEAVLFGNKDKKISFNCLTEKITSTSEMKVLGVIFDSVLSWKTHIDKTVTKVSRLGSGLKFLRRRLNKKHFINAVTSQFYGLLYYGCQVWLGPHTRASSIRKLNSIHYRLLRVVEQDWKKKKKRIELDQIGRVRPSTWGKYATGNLVIKIIRDENPHELNNALHRTLFVERRRPNAMQFFDNSRNILGRQSLQNRIGQIFRELSFDNFCTNISDSCLRIKLKESLKFN